MSYHNFVQYTARRIGHLVKFVNTTYTAVTQNECTTVNEIKPRSDEQKNVTLIPLKYKLFRIGIARNISCQANRRRSFPRSVDPSRCKLVYILSRRGFRTTRDG